MRRAARAVGLLVLLAGPALVACASTPPAGDATGGDRTGDPEFEAARRAARPEFESQADALAAGVYEPFVHPDSVAAAPADAAAARAETTPRIAGDPSTEELLGTLEPPPPYNPPDDPAAGAAGRVPPPAIHAAGDWALQMGAFDSETGALVRIQQLVRDFPDLPRWFAEESGTYRVYVGRFADREAAERARADVASRGYADAWVTRPR